MFTYPRQGASTAFTTKQHTIKQHKTKESSQIQQHSRHGVERPVLARNGRANILLHHLQVLERDIGRFFIKYPNVFFFSFSMYVRHLACS